MFTLQKGLYISDLVSSINIEHGFGTTAALSANTLSQSVRPVQTHSTHIGYVTDLSSLIYNDTDGLITTLDGVTISIKTADCVPVIYSDNQNRVIGIAHMGWRGVYDNFTAQMIKGMIASGAYIDTIKVAIGPSIGPCCYRMYGPRMDQFLKRWPSETEQSLIVHGSNTHLNLAQMIYLQTRQEGLKKQHIDYKPFCTRCDDHHFHSYQREGTGCDHMLSYITLLPDTI